MNCHYFSIVQLYSIARLHIGGTLSHDIMVWFSRSDHCRFYLYKPMMPEIAKTFSIWPSILQLDIMLKATFLKLLFLLKILHVLMRVRGKMPYLKSALERLREHIKLHLPALPQLLQQSRLNLVEWGNYLVDLFSNRVLTVILLWANEIYSFFKNEMSSKVHSIQTKSAFTKYKDLALLIMRLAVFIYLMSQAH